MDSRCPPDPHRKGFWGCVDDFLVKQVGAAVLPVGVESCSPFASDFFVEILLVNVVPVYGVSEKNPIIAEGTRRGRDLRLAFWVEAYRLPASGIGTLDIPDTKESPRLIGISPSELSHDRAGRASSRGD